MADADEHTEEQTGGDVLDFSQAQDFLNTTRTTLYRWIAQGKVRAFKAGRQWRMYRGDLERFLTSPDPASAHVDHEAVETAVDSIMSWQPDDSPSSEAPPVPAVDADEEEVDAVDVLVDQVLLAALRHKASDIHADPTESGGIVRLRIDGVLHTVAELPPDVLEALVARLKVMAGIDPSDSASLHMGRIKHTPSNGGQVHGRLQTLPAATGEKLTLRLLAPQGFSRTFDELGMWPTDRERVEQALVQPTGIVVFGGPTGSGKTTLLYAAVLRCNGDGNSAMSVESTVDYLLPGVVQIQTNPRAGLTVDQVLRGVMRADPDIIIVGDIPNAESAALAVEAALSGHMVLVQVHANDAIGGVQRLLDAGADPYLLGQALIASVNQRLVRKVCEHCREELSVDSETLVEWRTRAEAGGLEWPDQPTFVHGKGCGECRNVGYRGRTALYEVLTADAEVASLISRGASASDTVAAGVASGMTSLFADGMRKSLDGITSPLEVVRVTDAAWLTV